MSFRVFREWNLYWNLRNLRNLRARILFSVNTLQCVSQEGLYRSRVKGRDGLVAGLGAAEDAITLLFLHEAALNGTSALYKFSHLQRKATQERGVSFYTENSEWPKNRFFIGSEFYEWPKNRFSMGSEFSE